MAPGTILMTVVCYLLLLYGVAVLSSRRADNHTFFTGNRRMVWWVVALGMIGAPMSGVSFVSVPGSVATEGFTYFQMVLGFTVGQIIVALWLVPLFYREGVTSLYEWLARRFGAAAHRTGATLFLSSKLLLSALKLYVVSLMLQQLVFSAWGIPFWVNALLNVVLVCGYTLRGGVRSVVWTDILQTILLVAAVGVTCGVLLSQLLPEVPGLWSEIGATLVERTFVFHDPYSPFAFGKMVVGGIFILVAMTGLDQEMMQRNLSCPTPRDAQRNILLTALAQIIVIALLLLLGELLVRYLAVNELPLPAQNDALFAEVATGGTLPLGVGILFVLGLVSSTYATAGSALTALTTSVIYDLFPSISRRSSEKLTQSRHRIHLLLALVIGLLLLLYHHWVGESLIHLLFRIISLTYGPILGLFLYGTLSRRTLRSHWVAVVCVMAPLCSLLLQTFTQTVWGYFIGHELILYNALITVVGLQIISKKQ